MVETDKEHFFRQIALSVSESSNEGKGEAVIEAVKPLRAGYSKKIQSFNTTF